MSLKANFILFTFQLILAFTTPAFAALSGSGGGIDSGGGSSMAGLFIHNAYIAAEMIAHIKEFPLSPHEFSEIVRTTRVEVTTEKLFDRRGIEVDALNFPSLKLIRINEHHLYRLLTFKHVFKYQLIVHEYLAIAGIDDTDYKVSRAILGFEKISKLISCRMKHKYIVINYREFDDIDGNFEKADLEAYFEGNGMPEMFLDKPFMASLGNGGGQLNSSGKLLVWQWVYAYQAFFTPEHLKKKAGEFFVPYYIISTDSNLEKKLDGELQCRVFSAN